MTHATLHRQLPSSLCCFPLLVLGLLAAPTSARGAPAKPAPAKTKAEATRARARALNAQATRLFSLGMFAEAAEVYQQAYVVKPAPAFLYNLGQCHRRLPGVPNLKKAVFYFESFTNNAKPQSPLIPRARSQIAKLKRRIRALEKAANAPPPIYKRWWFWTAIGVAVVGATTATVFALQPDDPMPTPGTLDPGIVRTP